MACRQRHLACAGGRSVVNDGAPSAAVNNSRLGVTASLPLGRRQSIKVLYGDGIIVRSGTNFRNLPSAGSG